MFAVEITGEFKSQNLLHAGKAFNPRAVQAAEKAALDEATQAALAELRKTTQTWDTPVRFSAKRHTSPNGGYVEIMASNKIWLFLDQGTSVRYAVMTPGFKAKTKVGVLYSYAGAGQVSFVDSSRARPGIEARGWSGIVADRVAPIIRRVYQQELHARWIND